MYLTLLKQVPKILSFLPWPWVINGNIVSFKVRHLKNQNVFLESTFWFLKHHVCFFFFFSLHDIVSVGYHEKKERKKELCNGYFVGYVSQYLKNVCLLDIFLLLFSKKKFSFNVFLFCGNFSKFESQIQVIFQKN